MTGRDASGAARVNQAFRHRGWPASLAAVIALAAMLGWSWDAAAQGPPRAGSLIAAEPEPNALLATTPHRVSLTFAAPVDLESASVRVLRAGGVEAPLGPVQGDDLPTRISAPLQGPLAAGDYTVVWSVQTAGDGEILTGAYPFRTGIVENPGAARLEGEWPQPWAAISRWLVFLGASLAAAGFAWVRVLAPGVGSSAPGTAVRVEAMAVGALVALLATALPLFLNRVLTTANGPRSALTASLRAMPLGWWV